MGVTKKATVVAKTATRKRGRPVGSKNKPKPVDWEKLCKQLQGALAAQIKETDTYKAIVKDFESAAKPVADLSIWQRIKLAITGSY